MSDARLRYGIPDVELARDGGTLNPSDFAGHQLLVLFCPAEAEAACRELDHYGEFAALMSAFDTWLISVSPDVSGPACLASDPDGSAWQAFELLGAPLHKLERSNGAAFLFGRGGCLQRVWSGPGHAPDVVEEIRRRA